MGTAYAFPLTEVLASDEVDHRQLTAQVISGSVGVAEHHNGSYPIVLPGSEGWKRAVNVMQKSDIDLHADLAEWLLITRDDTFPGVNSSASVMIAWDTDMPLSTVLLETPRRSVAVPGSGCSQPAKTTRYSRRSWPIMVPSRGHSELP